MPPEIVPLLQLAGLVTVGLLLRSRVMVLLVAAVMTGLVLAGVHPADLAVRTPQQLGMDFGGIGVGLLAGLWTVATRRRRVDARRWAREIESASPRRRGAADVPRRTSLVAWMVASLMVALAAGAGLYLEGETVPEVRTTVDGWLASPTVRALGLPGLSTQKAAAPAPGRQGAATPSAPPAQGQSGDKPRARHASTGERPSGDLRHCLERGGTADVLRCAEQGR